MLFDYRFGGAGFFHWNSLVPILCLWRSLAASMLDRLVRITSLSWPLSISPSLHASAIIVASTFSLFSMAIYP